MDNYDIVISKITVIEEYEILQSKQRDAVIIVPNIKKMLAIKRRKNIENWYTKYRDDINYVFNKILSVYDEHDVKFKLNDEKLYDKFVEFLYSKYDK